MSGKSFIALFGIAVLLLLAVNSVYRVMETERAVHLRFGAIINDDITPGLHFKAPFIDDVRKFDARVLTVDAQPESFFTLEKKRLIVDSYVKFRVMDVGTYYRATGGDEQVAKNRIAARVNDGLRNEFGVRTLFDVVSGERDLLMQELTDSLNQSIEAALGVEVLDVRVQRIDLPDEISSAVYDRMRADREKLAREFRAQGSEEAEKIQADADRQKVLIEAEAYRQAEEIRGRGDAEATGIYAEAYSQDPEFYSFTRSLQAYQQSFSNRGDILLLEPDSEFFRYLKETE